MGRQLRIISESLDDGTREASAIASDPGADPERLAVGVEMFDRVEQALRKLPEDFRVIVWLRDGEDLSYQEIADTLDVPIGTVRSRLARAREALRNAVE